MEEAKKEVKREEQKIEKFFKNKSNLWMTVSIVLAVALVLAMIWPRGISQDQAKTSLVEYLNTMVGGGVTYKSIVDKGNLYEVTVNYKDQDIPVYITKDGKYMVQGATELNPSDAANTPTDTPAQTPTEVPKTDKPKVNAFVFAYCPYGLQFEKALIPVYNLLKSKADINVVFIGAMHGEYEKTESLRQVCIKKNYGNDKLFSYISKFAVNSDIGNCQGSDSCLTPLLSPIFTSLGIDKTKIDSCMTSDAQALYDADGQLAASAGVSGSPTFFINGVEATVDRTAESIKTAVCNAFTDASKPAECSQTLSATAATAGFGASAGTSTGASCG